MSCKKCKCKVCSCIVNEQVKIAVNKIVQNPDEKGVVNIKVPTKTSELINDSGFGQGGNGGGNIEEIRVNGVPAPIQGKVAIITVPTKTSDLTNDLNFVTKPYVDSHTINKNNPHNVTKEQINLGNVDNTSDLNKPISTATQNALNTKLNISDVRNEVVYQDLKPVNSVAIEKHSVKKVNTIADLRNTNGEYEGQVVELLGYYEAGDKEPLNYKWTNTQGVDDDGGVINSINGSWKAIFKSFINIKDFGAKTDGSDDSDYIQKAIDSTLINSVNKIFFPKSKNDIVINKSINVSIDDLKIFSNSAVISSDLDISIFNINNNKNTEIDGFVSGNTINKQTFIKANKSHNLSLTNCRFDGMKLGLDLTECYFFKINKVNFHSVYQAFKFIEATNGFSVTNVNISGNGVPSLIENTTTGGRISGCGFEGASGRLVFNRVFGIEVSGNYFEGYNENNVDYYIKCGIYATGDTVSGISINGNLFYTGANSAIYLNNVSGISINGNFCSSLHFVKLTGIGSVTQRNINYSGNSWRYQPSTEVGIPSSQAKEVITEDNDFKTANIAQESSFPFIFNKSLNDAIRGVENMTHQIGELDSSNENIGVAPMFHKWKSNNLLNVAYLNGSLILLEKILQQNESQSIQYEPFSYGCTTGIIIVHTGAGNISQWTWCRNINSAAKTGYLREVFNDANISLSLRDGYIDVTNNNVTEQYIKIEFKI